MNRAEKLARILRSPAYWAPLLRFGVAAAVEHEMLLASLCCRTVVDVGANCGQFALVVRRCLPQARLLSFEPLPGPADRYAAAVRGTRVHLYRVALGARHGHAAIHISRRNDSSSLLPIGALQTRYFPGTEEASTGHVEVRRLDELIAPGDLRPPALLKIDVQGYELQVLEGCAGLLPAFDFVYVECSFVELYEGQALAGDVIRRLDDAGFEFAGIANAFDRAAGRTLQADFLFVRSATPARHQYSGARQRQLCGGVPQAGAHLGR